MTALPAPSVALDDQLCFALYAASRAVTARYRPMLDALGVVRSRDLLRSRSHDRCAQGDGRGTRPG